MPSSSKTAKIGEPAFDPYDVLDIEQGASDADITKAYRKIARQLHPDKQQNLSEQEQQKLALEFHTLQDARAFLLDAEHAEARRAYDIKRASQRLRRHQDAQREKHMSERRKRMRDELRQKEHATTARYSNRDELLEKLRREGSNLRQQHSERAAMEESRKLSRQEKKTQTLLEERQVRIKWSRSRIQISPSEHSLAQLLSKQFGPVESVEIVGSKGNSALITFENPSSCRPCVDAYATSEEMRASFVGKRKQQYEEEMSKYQEELPTPLSRVNDQEGLEERKHRQTTERERMMREMEMEDAGHTVMKSKETPLKTMGRPFPLEYSDEDRNLTPLQKLEKFEKAVFGGVLSPERIRHMKVIP